jgi:hypothetical protein
MPPGADIRRFLLACFLDVVVNHAAALERAAWHDNSKEIP